MQIIQMLYHLHFVVEEQKTHYAGRSCNVIQTNEKVTLNQTAASRIVRFFHRIHGLLTLYMSHSPRNLKVVKT